MIPRVHSVSVTPEEYQAKVDDLSRNGYIYLDPVRGKNSVSITYLTVAEFSKLRFSNSESGTQ